MIFRRNNGSACRNCRPQARQSRKPPGNAAPTHRRRLLHNNSFDSAWSSAATDVSSHSSIQFCGKPFHACSSSTRRPCASAAAYQITGSARSGKTPLPGATVTAANTLTGKNFAAVTNLDGKFDFAEIPAADTSFELNSWASRFSRRKLFSILKIRRQK